LLVLLGRWLGLDPLCLGLLGRLCVLLRLRVLLGRLCVLLGLLGDWLLWHRLLDPRRALVVVLLWLGLLGLLLELLRLGLLWLGLLWLNGTPVVHVPSLLVLTTALAVTVSALGLGVSAATRDRRFAQFLYSTGLLVVFGAALLLPENPANTIARLAVGSPGPGTFVALAGYVLIAVVAVAAVRQLPRLVDADHL
jgi:hypothetical protein